MDGVLPRTPSNRPRAGAVVALTALCLVGAPLMSLFPGGVWAAFRSLPVDSATVGVLLLAPAVVGALLAMFWVSSRLLRAAGVNHHVSCAGLVTAVSVVVPVFTAVLAPFPYESPVFTAALAALICALALGACAVPHPLPRRWRYPGAVPAVAVTAVLFLMLPAASDRAISHAASAHAQEQIASFGDSITVLEHPRWELTGAYRVHHGLRLTYEQPDQAGEPHEAGGGPGGPAAPDLSAVHVVSWTDRDLHKECDFHDVRCEPLDETSTVERPDSQARPDSPHWPGEGMLTVQRPGGAADEIRAQLADGSVASVIVNSAEFDGDLVEKAERLRVEGPDDRESLIAALAG
ncbi:hypothetical protein IDM40_25335 [Nocardiopsis sp. HNM0947]|uniref:Uncharacterized protein n=1 Tax=Nocardiopsis coralli TaxID=2772213 RepID=A0ABR9PDS3_9ACTN|nr:hypothetical protein [Nocardiopsis coralli]MBE3001994.1 hypothetical protein [Nocardiopsis coralli]